MAFHVLFDFLREGLLYYVRKLDKMALSLQSLLDETQPILHYTAELDERRMYMREPPHPPMTLFGPVDVSLKVMWTRWWFETSVAMFSKTHSNLFRSHVEAVLRNLVTGLEVKSGWLVAFALSEFKQLQQATGRKMVRLRNVLMGRKGRLESLGDIQLL
jgi:hypothetical protein